MSEHERELTTSDIAGTSPARDHDVERGDTARPSDDQRHEPLFSPEDGTQLRGQWDVVQTTFVDDPRGAVQQADALVAQTIQNLAASFSGERSRLEDQWSQGQDVSTEDLRVAFQRYRSFFDRLLSI